jgi:hypothetical protein
MRLAAKELFRGYLAASWSETRSQYLRRQVSHSYLLLFDEQNQDVLERRDRLRKRPSLPCKVGSHNARSDVVGSMCEGFPTWDSREVLSYRNRSCLSGRG